MELRAPRAPSGFVAPDQVPKRPTLPCHTRPLSCLLACLPLSLPVHSSSSGAGWQVGWLEQLQACGRAAGSVCRLQPAAAPVVSLHAHAALGGCVWVGGARYSRTTSTLHPAARRARTDCRRCGACLATVTCKNTNVAGRVGANTSCCRCRDDDDYSIVRRWRVIEAACVHACVCVQRRAPSSLPSCLGEGCSACMPACLHACACDLPNRAEMGRERVWRGDAVGPGRQSRRAVPSL